MKNFAIQTAQKAGKLILDHFNRLGKNDVSYKSSHELLTKFDIESEKLIISEIQKKFPNHAIISEEAGELPKNSDYTWIIDPLDGTTNFKIGSPFWAVSIALVKTDQYIDTPITEFSSQKTQKTRLLASAQNDNNIVLGVIYAPAMKELYLAEKGKGAYLNGNPAKQGLNLAQRGKKIHVSQQADFKNAINTYCHGSRTSDIVKAVKIYDYLKLHTRDCRQLGSAALELGFVAAGRTESINIPGAHKWDVAAGVLLVREADGRVTDFNGKEWNLGSRDILASNGLVHNGLLKIINSSPIANFSNNQYYKDVELIYPELSYKIVGILFSVHNKLGYGLREKTYEEAVVNALKIENMKYKRQLKCELKYNNNQIKYFFLDLLIDDKIVLEIKAQDRFDKNNLAQVYEYLKANNLKLGIIANFTKHGLKYKRIINKFAI